MYDSIKKMIDLLSNSGSAKRPSIISEEKLKQLRDRYFGIFWPPKEGGYDGADELRDKVLFENKKFQEKYSQTIDKTYDPGNYGCRLYFNQVCRIVLPPP